MRTRKLLQRDISACYFSYVLPHRSHKWRLLWGICGVHRVMWCSPCKESLCRENAPALQKYTGKEDEKNKRRVFSPLMPHVVFRSSLGLKTRVRKQFSDNYETPLPIQCERALHYSLFLRQFCHLLQNEAPFTSSNRVLEESLQIEPSSARGAVSEVSGRLEPPRSAALVRCSEWRIVVKKPLYALK